MKHIRWLVVPAFAALMAFMVMSATPSKALAESCRDRQTGPWSNFTLSYMCSVSGDVLMDNQPQYDNNVWTGLIVTCANINGCNGSTQYWGASISGRTPSDLQAEMLRTGCGTGSGCSYVNMVSWTGYQPPAYVPQPMYPPYQPPTLYPSGTTQSGWAGPITVGASGPSSWIIINGAGGYDQNCWYPSTPGAGTAVNEIPNISISNPPVGLRLCAYKGMEVRSARFEAGQYAQIQGVAIALDGGRSCNSGNCVTNTATATSTGGVVYYLVPVGSNASPFTPWNQVQPNNPPTVAPGSTPKYM